MEELGQLATNPNVGILIEVSVGALAIIGIIAWLVLRGRGGRDQGS